MFQIFTRDELVSESGHVEVHIRVNNAQLGLVTYWDLAKFKTRLDQMRDIDQAMPTPGSASSHDSDSINLSGGDDQGDPFNDPTDNWVKDSVITPLPSPHRYIEHAVCVLNSMCRFHDFIKRMVLFCLGVKLKCFRVSQFRYKLHTFCY